jgi:hypothetical protein
VFANYCFDYFNEHLFQRLVESGEKSMNALARYGEVAGDQYVKEEGREIGADATGVPYSFPRYMMLDFLVQPIFAEEGRLVDLEPVFDESGARTGSRFILQQGDRVSPEPSRTGASSSSNPTSASASGTALPSARSTSTSRPPISRTGTRSAPTPA